MEKVWNFQLLPTLDFSNVYVSTDILNPWVFWRFTPVPWSSRLQGLKCLRIFDKPHCDILVLGTFSSPTGSMTYSPWTRTSYTDHFLAFHLLAWFLEDQKVSVQCKVSDVIINYKSTIYMQDEFLHHTAPFFVPKNKNTELKN